MKPIATVFLAQSESFCATVANIFRVAVVTVSYGSGPELETFRASLRQYEEAGLAVAVVDNKPDAEGVQEITERFGASYLALPQNPGYGAGMNAGARLLAAELPVGEVFDAVFVCNPDVEFVEPAVQQLATKLMQDQLTGSVGPALLNEDGSVYPSARNIPSISTGVGHALFGKVWPANPWSKAYKNALNNSREREAGWLSGAAVMVKSSVWQDIGGFDEDYFLNFEDIDLGYRIGLAGYRNVYVPSVRVKHSGAHSTDKHEVVAERAMHDGAIRFMRKRYSGFIASPIRWLSVLGLRVRGALKVAALRRAQRSA